MDTGTVAFERVAKWESSSARLKLERIDRLFLPRGVFVLTEKHHYHPTLVLCEPADFYSRRMNLALVYDETRLSDPATLHTLGCFYAPITNTGHRTLHVGDQFTLEWPTEEDLRAQRDSVKYLYFKQTHANVSELMWNYEVTGGFLATVPHTYQQSRQSLEKRLATELDWEGSRGLLYALGKVQETARYVPAGADISETDTEFLTPLMLVKGETSNLSETVLRTRITNAKTPLKKLATACAEFAVTLQPRIVGVVECSVIGNEQKIPPGAQFKAFIMFK